MYRGNYLEENYGAHTLRKTRGYIQRTKYWMGFEIVCKRFLRDGIIFRTTVRFFKCPHRYMKRSGETNDLFVGGFKNSCRLTIVNLNNLRSTNQDFYILNSILFFSTKIFDPRNVWV
jgi:hypothetical protein